MSFLAFLILLEREETKHTMAFSQRAIGREKPSLPLEAHPSMLKRKSSYKAMRDTLQELFPGAQIIYGLKRHIKYIYDLVGCQEL